MNVKKLILTNLPYVLFVYPLVLKNKSCKCNFPVNLSILKKQ